VLNPLKTPAATVGQGCFQQVPDVSAVNRARGETASLQCGIVVNSRPAQEIVGRIAPSAHLTRGHVKKVKSVRAAVGEASPRQCPPVHNGYGQGCGAAQQVYGQ